MQRPSTFACYLKKLSSPSSSICLPSVSLLSCSSSPSRRFLALAPRVDPLFIDYKSNTRLKEFNSAIAKNLKNIQKKVKDDPEDDRIATISAVIQSRGFDITWNENDSVLSLEKTGECGEMIYVSIYQEVSRSEALLFSHHIAL
jgi:hypothetical protein